MGMTAGAWCPEGCGWGPTPCRYCGRVVTCEQRVLLQREIVTAIRGVSDKDLALAEAVAQSGGMPSSRRLLWAAMRLACERPELWDALCQVRQVVMLTDACEGEP